MSTIKVKCVKHTISLLDSPEITSGSDNVDTVQFEFCDSWGEFQKIAVFYQQKGELYYSLIDDNLQAIIPKEVLNKSGVMNLGVIGVKGDKTKTSAILRYRIDNGAINGYEVADPDPDLYEQLLNKYTEIRDIFNQMSKEQSDFVDKVNKEHSEFMNNANETINDANDLMFDMKDILSAIKVTYYDLDGGTPYTEATSDEYDCDGGYPMSEGD